MTVPIESIETLTLAKVSVVRVHMADGAVGLGQTGGYHGPIVADVLHTLAAPHFLGHTLDAHEACLNGCWRQHYKFAGPFLARAIAGIDTALWDLRAKTAGKPVHALIGSQPRDRVPVYGSSMRRDTSVAEEINALKQAADQFGLSHFKVKIGTRMGDDDPAGLERAEALIPALRRAFPDAGLIADANGAFSQTTAIRLGRLMEAEGFSFFEEPCPHTDLSATRAVADALEMPVSGGEVEHRAHVFDALIDERIVDIVQPDLCNSGGFSQAILVADRAGAAGLVCKPHCAQHSLVQVFTMHLAAAHPAVTGPQEWRITDDRPWSKVLYTPMPTVEDGHVARPAGSGWGVEMHPDLPGQAQRRVSSQSTDSWQNGGRVNTQPRSHTTRHTAHARLEGQWHEDHRR